MSKSSINRLSGAGLLIALGIIYGDIGTSPLYVLNAIIRDREITHELIIGAVSCVIWTLTLQTTIKYIVLTLRADNNGEGGIFSLYALVRRHKKWLLFPAIIGGASLLADGMITPSISIMSSIEGLKQISVFSHISRDAIVYIVLAILAAIFITQQFGTATIGKTFGPVMFLWFLMLAVLGLIHIFDGLYIFKAFNPYYAINLLVLYPKGFWILGAVFLCTTGAEALYSDLGHCGRRNIRVSWVFVKTALILNYLGQGAWLLSHHSGKVFTKEIIESGFNPFFGVMHDHFRLIGILIATIAAIIASQALISGSFTLISEAMRLNLWPKLKINYPSEERGQLFIPRINMMMFVGSAAVTLYFRSSSNMEGAYGLAITLCMLATSILYANYLVTRRAPSWVIYLYLAVYLTIELSFLIANLLDKFPQGGFITLLIAGVLFSVMYVWYRARKIKNRYVEFVRLDKYLPAINKLSTDSSVPKYATHLVYLTSADNPKEIEHKIIFSILGQKPKRADIYWLVHVDTQDDPYTSKYMVENIIPNEIIRIDLKLGFRQAPRISVMFRKIVRELILNDEVQVTSKYPVMQENAIPGDLQFVVMEKFLSQDNELPFFERLVMKLYFLLKHISLSEEKGFGLEQSNVTVEKFPLIVAPIRKLSLTRVYPEE
ncbi:MAG: KUP/HAK/KT family potassium transporter [Chitinophagaceae bacterium]|nr:KUP/HAK/KT family potassium transporter [Chitinophagaceae bacterium]